MPTKKVYNFVDTLIDLLVKYKVRATLEYDSRVHAIRIYLTQEQPNRRRRGMERCWSIENLSKMQHPEDFLETEMQDFIGAFDTHGDRQTE